MLEGCKFVYFELIRICVVVLFDLLMISLEVEGLDERKRLEERICELLNKRDRLKFVYECNCDINVSLKESLLIELLLLYLSGRY